LLAVAASGQCVPVVQIVTGVSMIITIPLPVTPRPA
jgi:hypothetical protein